MKNPMNLNVHAPPPSITIYEPEFDCYLLYNLKFFKYYIISYLYVFFTDAVWSIF